MKQKDARPDGEIRVVPDAPAAVPAPAFDWDAAGVQEKRPRFAVTRGDLARAVIMAEILGPPLAKKNDLKRRP